MGRSGITYHDVVHAAQQLSGQGENPTIQSVRTLLGTGSTSTIGPHLKTWKTEQDEDAQLMSKENLPPELVALMKGLWERLNQQADEKIAAHEEKANEEIAEIFEALQSEQAEHAQLQLKYQEIAEQFKELSYQKITLDGNLEQSKQDNAALLTKNQINEQRLADKEKQLTELHHLQEQAQANLAHFRETMHAQREKDRTDAEQQKNKLEQEVSLLKKELSNTLQAHQTLQQTSTQLHHEQEHLIHTHEKLEETCKATQSKLEETREAYLKTQHTERHWQEQYQNASVDKQKLSETIDNLRKEIIIKSENLKTITATLQETQQQNLQLSQEQWSLVQEKARLEGQLKQWQESVSEKI